MRFSFVYVVPLLCGLAAAVPAPFIEFRRSLFEGRSGSEPRALIEYRRSLHSGRSESEPVKYTEAPNVNKTWILSNDFAPVAVSFHYEKPLSEEVHKQPEFLAFLKRIDELILCPAFLANDTAPKKPLVPEDSPFPLFVVFTDNKNYFVSVDTSGEDATVLSVTKLVNPLPPQDELKVREKVEELNFDFNPIAEVTKEECLKPQ